MAKNSEKSILKYFKNQVLTEEKKCNFGSKKTYVFQPLKRSKFKYFIFFTVLKIKISNKIR
ncbi:hypothetical protein B4N84_27605 [Flavobacterium sp. IR1]|nr:hypothetical protein B4N84_27605 [Flavobacterium sp. IR1]